MSDTVPFVILLALAVAYAVAGVLAINEKNDDADRIEAACLKDGRPDYECEAMALAIRHAR
jgi:hypothetical protein